jgi:hypothetical protein
MRKSKNTPAAASRPATKPSKRDAADAMRSATEYLIAARRAARALKAGNCAPSFRLRDQRGVEVASETLLRHGPLLLTFYTGSWCPAWSRDLQAFESLRPSVEARGASLVGISQQTVAESAKVHVEAGISDSFGSRRPDCPAVRRALVHSGAPPTHHRKSGIDLPLLDGDESWTLPIPACFILDRARTSPTPRSTRPVRPLPAARGLARAGPPRSLRAA